MPSDDKVNEEDEDKLMRDYEKASDSYEKEAKQALKDKVDLR